jgi:cytochrome P450
MTVALGHPDRLADITTPEFGANASVNYANMRRTGPLSWQPGGKGWLLLRYADAVRALRTAEFTESVLSDMWQKLGRRLGKNYDPMLRLLALTPFQHEGERHEQSRRTFARAIAPFARRNQVFARRIRAMLTPFVADGGFDLADDFGNYVLFQILCDLMEIPESDRGPIRRMARNSRILESTLSVKYRDEAISIISECLDYLVRHARHQIERDSSCLIGSIYGELPTQEPDKFATTAAIAAIMLVMGNDALGSCVSHGVRQLLGGGPVPQSTAIRQAEWSAVTDDVIRFAAPVDLMSRVMQNDATVAGCPFKAGTRLIISALAANHDPDAFGPMASEIRPDGTGELGITFGAGSHVCIGNSISRNIIREAYGALGGLPPMRLAGPARYTRGNVVRVIASLPVEFA